MKQLQRVAIAIGTNLGDRYGVIRFAVARLSALLSNHTLSDIIETEPEGEGTEGQPLYLNAVLVGETSLSPRALLDNLLAIEHDFGRTRPARGAARTLDLDLVLFGDAIVDEPGLTVPHPRFAIGFSCLVRWRRWRLISSIR